MLNFSVDTQTSKCVNAVASWGTPFHVLVSGGWVVSLSPSDVAPRVINACCLMCVYDQTDDREVSRRFVTTIFFPLFYTGAIAISKTQ